MEGSELPEVQGIHIGTTLQGIDTADHTHTHTHTHTPSTHLQLHAVQSRQCTKGNTNNNFCYDMNRVGQATKHTIKGMAISISSSNTVWAYHQPKQLKQVHTSSCYQPVGVWPFEPQSTHLDEKAGHLIVSIRASIVQWDQSPLVLSVNISAMFHHQLHYPHTVVPSRQVEGCGLEGGGLYKVQLSKKA